jgi:hypothetical protein
MGLRNCSSAGESSFADLTGTDPVAGQFSEALAEFGNIQLWNLRLRVLYFYQK